MLILRSLFETGDLVTSVWMTLFGVGVRLVKLYPFIHETRQPFKMSSVLMAHVQRFIMCKET